MIELIATKDFIVTVLNEALLQDRTSITIHSPFLNLELLGLDLRGHGSVEFLVRESDYARASSALQSKLPPPYDREVPDLADFREALHSSLLLPPNNMNELILELRRMEDKRRQPSRHPKQPCLALDTNVAYKRLFSRLLLYSDACGSKDYDVSRVQLLIADLVDREVAERVRNKYSPKDINMLKRAFHYPQGLDLMLNCLHKDGRRAMAASAELTAIRSKYSVWDVKGGMWHENKEERDAEILRSLGRYAEEQRLDLLFLSTDDKASAAAEAARVPIMVLRYPNEIPERIPFDPWLIPELIYDLALTFGMIQLKGLGLRMLGDWGGKTAEDFKAEKVKIIAEQGSRLGESLEKDLRILRRLRTEVDLNGLR
ncbi:MAG: hypothetical protein QW520_01975 [Methanomassiliicoccales archaeon]